ncbi:unnamed protein product [Nesidiocoris tenuis]|uniref:GIY-YIG domain-containing protein n=1 Tax=Nesidiocoris tenuis TaxID=355587 RepID=A0A6H5FZN8_9HEMI|nr:unnamed protein product [Nesidiocoris tenuis]
MFHCELAFLFLCEFDFGFDCEFDFMFHSEFDFNFDYEFDFVYRCFRQVHDAKKLFKYIGSTTDRRTHRHLFRKREALPTQTFQFKKYQKRLRVEGAVAIFNGFPGSVINSVVQSPTYTGLQTEDTQVEMAGTSTSGLEASENGQLSQERSSETAVTSTTDSTGELAVSDRRLDSVKFRGMVYVKGLSEQLGKALHKKVDCRLAFKNVKSLNNKVFSKLKSPIPFENRSAVVYSVPCGSCEKEYVGHTAQYLKNRMSGHKSDIAMERAGCALAQHALNKGHVFDFENCKILDTESNKAKREIKEMIYIARNRVEHCCESNLQPARHTQARHFNALPADRLGPAAFSNGPGPRPVHSHYWKSWFAASAAAAAA